MPSTQKNKSNSRGEIQKNLRQKYYLFFVAYFSMVLENEQKPKSKNYCSLFNGTYSSAQRMPQ